jgi:gluconokinase
VNNDVLEVVVMGVTGSGKSTVGHALAQRLGLAFADGDAFHSPANIEKMTRGIPLDDADRAQWLATIAEWLRAHRGTGAVVACSALRRRYRDILRTGAPQAVFLHLVGPPEEVAARVAGRTAHFMPTSLVESQIRTLEPLEPDERGVVIAFDDAIDDIVDTFLEAARAWQQP